MRQLVGLLSIALGFAARDASAQAAPPPNTTPGDAKSATTTAKKPSKKPSTGNIAQWPGFRLTDDGGSEVMVEFSSNPKAPTEHRAAGSITYVFKGAHVIKANNQNPLITVHFNTPMVSARLVPKKGELHLIIELRPGVSVTPAFGLRASSDGDGQQFFVKFASGSFLPKGAENEEGAPTQKLKSSASETKPAAGTKTESGGKTGPAP